MILYVCGILPPEDTLHVFICHFPSRRGGELESEKNRIYAALCLRDRVDSIQQSSGKDSKILIMGDFNDYPDNTSVRHVLKAQEYTDKTKVLADGLYNLCYSLHKKQESGSYKYAGQWGMLDQIIVSGSLLQNTGWQCKETTASVFNPQWLLVTDKRYMGVRPYSTYWGRKYQGGYSDHLPVYVDLWNNQ